MRMKTRERQIRWILKHRGEPMKNHDKWAYRYFYDVRYLLRELDKLKKAPAPVPEKES